jgi:hypothetical protein
MTMPRSDALFNSSRSLHPHSKARTGIIATLPSFSWLAEQKDKGGAIGASKPARLSGKCKSLHKNGQLFPTPHFNARRPPCMCFILSVCYYLIMAFNVPSLAAAAVSFVH